MQQPKYLSKRFSKEWRKLKILTHIKHACPKKQDIYTPRGLKVVITTAHRKAVGFKGVIFIIHCIFRRSLTCSVASQ